MDRHRAKRSSHMARSQSGSIARRARARTISRTFKASFAKTCGAARSNVRPSLATSTSRRWSRLAGTRRVGASRLIWCSSRRRRRRRLPFGERRTFRTPRRFAPRRPAGAATFRAVDSASLGYNTCMRHGLVVGVFGLFIVGCGAKEDAFLRPEARAAARVHVAAADCPGRPKIVSAPEHCLFDPGPESRVMRVDIDLATEVDERGAARGVKLAGP